MQTHSIRADLALPTTVASRPPPSPAAPSCPLPSHPTRTPLPKGFPAPSRHQRDASTPKPTSLPSHTCKHTRTGTRGSGSPICRGSTLSSHLHHLRLFTAPCASKLCLSRRQKPLHHFYLPAPGTGQVTSETQPRIKENGLGHAHAAEWLAHAVAFSQKNRKNNLGDNGVGGLGFCT